MPKVKSNPEQVKLNASKKRPMVDTLLKNGEVEITLLPTYRPKNKPQDPSELVKAEIAFIHTSRPKQK